MDSGHETLNNAKPVINNLQNKQGTIKDLIQQSSVEITG